MANNNLDQQIRSRIESFLDEMTALVRASALESVQAALGGGSTPTVRRGPGRPRSSIRRGSGRPPKAASAATNGRRVRRSTEDLEQLGSQVLTYVKANPGHRLEEIGVGLKTDTGILKRPIANLLAARSLHTEGQKRGTKYFAGGGRGGARSAGAAKARGAKAGRKARAVRKGSRKKAGRRPTKTLTPQANRGATTKPIAPRGDVSPAREPAAAATS